MNWQKKKPAALRLFPRCIVYVRLSSSSWALFIKLLKITNYPSLAAYRTPPKPQRKPVVLTLTGTTHDTPSKYSFLSFSLSVFNGLYIQCFYICQSFPCFKVEVSIKWKLRVMCAHTDIKTIVTPHKRTAITVTGAICKEDYNFLILHVSVWNCNLACIFKMGWGWIKHH